MRPGHKRAAAVAVAFAFLAAGRVPAALSSGALAAEPRAGPVRETHARTGDVRDAELRASGMRIEGLRALDAGATAAFERLGPAGPGEWRTVFPEPAQPVVEYTLTVGRALAYEKRKVTVLPLGAAGEGDGETFAALRSFLGAFFMTRVDLEERAGVPDDVPRRRSRGFGRQLLADEVVRSISRGRSPGTVARLAVASDDLYASSGRGRSGGYLNFVFGLGACGWRAAVCSRARLGRCYQGEPEGITPRKRLFKIASHELGHVFGLAHCQTYRCAMNGFNSLTEFDARPVHLCPECLGKLAFHLGFDRAMRYRVLVKAYRRLGWDDEAAFAARRASVEATNALTRVRPRDADAPVVARPASLR